MHVGLSVYDIAPRELVELAKAAETAGFRTLWLGEHVVLPVDYRAEHPASSSPDNTAHIARIIDPATQLLDPLIALGAVAAATDRLQLATGIYLLPLRHPLAVARMTLTLQGLAGGRFMLGVGSGWLEEEFAALGVPFDERGARFDEALTVLRAAWAGGELANAGPHYPFDRVMATPVAVDVPLVLGGNTERALRRAARLADGWFSSGNPTFDEAVRLRARLDRSLRRGRAGASTADLRAHGRARPGRPGPLRRARLRARDRLGQPTVAGRGRPGIEAGAIPARPAPSCSTGRWSR